MPDCGHYTHYRRVHATVKHFRGFVLTNCMNKFVCAQLEASGRPPGPCAHMLMPVDEVARGGVWHKEVCGLPGQVCHTWPCWHHWQDVSKSFNCCFSLGTGKYGDLGVSPELKCALFIFLIMCLLCANDCPQASSKCARAWSPLFPDMAELRWKHGSERQCWSASEMMS